MSKKTNLLTSKGYKQLKANYIEFVNVKRVAALERLKEARDMGNLEDNIQYESAKSALEVIDAKISELEKLIKTSSIIEDEAQDISIVQIGVTVIIEVEGDKEEYTIVDPFESNPLENKISHESPVGKALLGKGVGEVVIVELPYGAIDYTIIEIK